MPCGILWWNKGNNQGQAGSAVLAQNATDLELHHMQAACDPAAAAAAIAAEASGVSKRGLPLQPAAENMLAAA